MGGHERSSFTVEIAHGVVGRSQELPGVDAIQPVRAAKRTQYDGALAHRVRFRAEWHAPLLQERVALCTLVVDGSRDIWCAFPAGTMQKGEYMTRLNLDPFELRVVESSTGFAVLADDLPLTTPDGQPICHEARPLLEHMVSEYQQHPEVVLEGSKVVEPRFLGAYSLMCLQMDWVQPGRDNVSEDFELAFVQDPVLQPLPGPERNDQHARYEPLRAWLKGNGFDRLPDVGFVQTERLEQWDFGLYGAEDTELFLQLRNTLEAEFHRFSPEEKAGVVMLHNIHHGALLHAMMLIQRQCTPLQYSAGVNAAHGIFLAVPDVNEEAHRSAHDELSGDAKVTLDYIDAYRAGTPAATVMALIQEGAESTDVEFKSTLRWDLAKETKSRAITLATLKTIAAFMNTRGGTLLIGVNDDAVVVGVESDQFKTDDAFLRHLYVSITNAMGVAVSQYVNARMARVHGGTVCVVECRLSPEPVYLQEGGKVIFYVRTGPATIQLSEQDQADWIKSRALKASLDQESPN